MDIQLLAQTISSSFLEAMPDPAWVKDPGHRYVVVNSAFRKMCQFQTGGAEIDVIDVTDFNLFPLELAEPGERQITLQGDLDDEQRQRLLQVAEACPVHKLLAGEVHIQTALQLPA